MMATTGPPTGPEIQSALVRITFWIELAKTLSRDIVGAIAHRPSRILLEHVWCCIQRHPVKLANLFGNPM